MSELSLLEMLFMYIIFGFVVAIIFSSFIFIGIIIYLLIDYKFREMLRLIKEFFSPTPRLPEEVIEKVLKEAAELVWSKHRPLNEDLYREYIWVSEEMLSKKWEKMYGKNL